jgi:aryl-alcohol dehydrogenase-like predicted oxidoreductase
MDHIPFGQTGLTVSRLGIGTGTHGWGHRSEQTALGIQGLANLLLRGYDLGVNFWDAADQYGSHPHVAEALKSVDRDEVVIVTKTTSKQKRGVAKDVDRFLKELGTDVIDVVLLHGLSRGDWPRKYSGAMAALTEAKAAGKVRAVGFSSHGLNALRAGVTEAWAEVILVRTNHVGVNMDGTPDQVEPVIRDLHAAGKAIYAMKVLGCGRLTDDVRGAFDYVLRQGTVHALSIGTSSQQELETNVKLMEELAPRRPVKGSKHS